MVILPCYSLRKRFGCVVINVGRFTHSALELPFSFILLEQTSFVSVDIFSLMFVTYEERKKRENNMKKEQKSIWSNTLTYIMNTINCLISTWRAHFFNWNIQLVLHWNWACNDPFYSSRNYSTRSDRKKIQLRRSIWNGFEKLFSIIHSLNSLIEYRMPHQPISESIWSNEPKRIEKKTTTTFFLNISQTRSEFRASIHRCCYFFLHSHKKMGKNRHRNRTQDKEPHTTHKKDPSS